MLMEARKHPLLERVYARYGRQLLRRAFARVWVGGESWPAGDGPTIAFLNHSAWWDPVLALFLSHDLFRRDGYGIMQGTQLASYPFFRRVGCFGATGESFEDVRALSVYAARLLSEGTRRTLWIFPQGELEPSRSPLAFRSGASRLARTVPEAPLVPVAVRYEFRNEQRPELFVRLGPAVRPASGAVAAAARDASPLALTRALEQRLRVELSALDEDLLHPAPEEVGYRVALEGRGSLSTFYSRTLGRLPGMRDAGSG
ncbi:MAG TPA: lysophospholipid acyltransferase family protein [Gemmatimonadaceae bacterium]|nr:lysophospholipid acyltransferase family protein [Gemmatimonadaceae bacterium]